MGKHLGCVWVPYPFGGLWVAWWKGQSRTRQGWKDVQGPALLPLLSGSFRAPMAGAGKRTFLHRHPAGSFLQYPSHGQSTGRSPCPSAPSQPHHSYKSLLPHWEGNVNGDWLWRPGLGFAPGKPSGWSLAPNRHIGGTISSGFQKCETPKAPIVASKNNKGFSPFYSLI